MKSYNGFTAQQRQKAFNWFKHTKRNGGILEAKRCVCCGSQLLVKGHSEDYSEPYGPHIGAFDLCFICHMMLHCRGSSPERFIEYATAVTDNLYRWEPSGMNWRFFCRDFLEPAKLDLRAATHPAQEQNMVSLHQLGEGRYNPNVNPHMARYVPQYKLEHYESWVALPS